MITFRKAILEDDKLLFEWRNAPKTRQGSCYSDELDWETHVKWFQEKLESLSSHIYIIHNLEGTPIGMVRFDMGQEHAAIISITVDSNHEGHGYGLEGVVQTSAHIFEKCGIKEVLAYVKKDNVRSYNLFRRAKFQEIGEKRIHSSDCYVMRLEQAARRNALLEEPTQ